MEDFEKKYLNDARHGDHIAQFILGGCYYKAQKYKEAVYWFTKAAKQCDAMAQNNLAVCYQKGEGVVKSHSRAFSWFRKAARQGIAAAQYIIYISYRDGNGVPKDKDEAVFWLREAAKQKFVKAQYNLACNYYFNEDDNKKDKDTALYWFEQAIENNVDGSLPEFALSNSKIFIDQLKEMGHSASRAKDI